MSYRYEPYMNFASLDQITRVINSINQSKIFGWSNEEKDKVLEKNKKELEENRKLIEELKKN